MQQFRESIFFTQLWYKVFLLNMNNFKHISWWDADRYYRFSQSGPESNGNEWLLLTHQTSRTGALSLTGWSFISISAKQQHLVAQLVEQLLCLTKFPWAIRDIITNYTRSVFCSFIFYPFCFLRLKIDVSIDSEW